MTTVPNYPEKEGLGVQPVARPPVLQRRPTYSQAMHLLGGAQKPGYGVPAYTRWVNRRLARHAAAAAAGLGISANAVTLLSAAFSVVAVTLIAAATPSGWLGLGIAVLLAAGYVLDSADGQVARLAGLGSPAGEWLDHLVDAVRVPAIHLAVMVGMWRSGLPEWTLWLPLAYTLMCIGHFMSQILAEQLLKSRHSLPVLDQRTMSSWLRLPTDMGVLCWIFIGWGNPGWFAAAYGCLFLFNAAVVVRSVRRKYLALSAPE